MLIVNNFPFLSVIIIFLNYIHSAFFIFVFILFIDLASATENHSLFVEEGMLGLLISLSTANDAEARQYAAYAMVKLSQNGDVRKMVTEEGGALPRPN